jgi:hypothetical protein
VKALSPARRAGDADKLGQGKRKSEGHQAATFRDTG